MPRRRERNPACERRDTARAIGDSDAVQRRAAGDIRRVRGHGVAQRRVRRIRCAGVANRDRIAQALAGEQHVGGAVEVRRELADFEIRRGLNRHARRILVADDVGIGLAVDVRVVAVGDLDSARDQVGLIRDDHRVVDPGRERHVELHRDLTERGDVEIAHIDEPGAVRAAARVRVARVGARRQSSGHEGQRARNEHDGRIHGAEIVRERQIVERHVGALNTQRVAQDVAGLGRRRRIRAARNVRDALLVEEAIQRRCDGVRVLVIREADGAVCQRARIRDAIRVRVVVVRPLRRADEVRQRDAVLGV